MKKNTDELLNQILKDYEYPDYPESFLSKYDLMECLSDHNGTCTFLVQDHNEKSFIAKSYEKSVWTITDNSVLLKDLEQEGIPRHTATFETDSVLISVREYVEGVPLNRYAAEKDLSEAEIVKICVELCDILSFLHHRKDPVIHRDIKPQNIIIRPDGSVCLIDFDIARVYRSGNETDTVFFGTQAYAPPEQYGFSQTDPRSDIYSLGVLLRWLLTGSTKENNNIRVYRPLEKIIRKCTAFSPEERYSDVSQVRKMLLNANPKKQGIRIAILSLCCAAAAFLLAFGGIKLYQYITYTPFTADAVPSYLSDSERVEDAVNYMKKKYQTNLFDETEDTANIGILRTLLTDVYGLDRDYVYGINQEMPQESDEYFLPWGWDDAQTIDRDIMLYAAIKAFDPSIVADWSSLKDDNGFYPGVRVAVEFADKYGLAEGVNRPRDLSLGDMAVIFANCDRLFESRKK